MVLVSLCKSDYFVRMLTSIPPLSIQVAQIGAPIEPLKRLQILDDKEFEQLIEAWTERLKGKYHSSIGLGGAGDEGLDVVGFKTDKKFLGIWDAYQCKRRGAPLTPSDVWVDIGKVVWYVSQGHYTCPRLYAFTCNFGIGTSLNKYLGNADKLKAEVRRLWDTHIASNITVKGEGIVRLEGNVLETFDKMDFSIFTSLKPSQVLTELEGTSYYLKTFGGGLPQRPVPGAVPNTVAPHEMVYVEKLRKAYESNLGTAIPDISGIGRHRRLGRHFESQRRAFYSAESLREFSKDTVPAGTFEALQQDMHDGLQPILALDHSTSFERLNETLAQAVSIPLTANPLATVSTNADKSGMCHQLANDNRIDWDEHD